MIGGDNSPDIKTNNVSPFVYSLMADSLILFVLFFLKNGLCNSSNDHHARNPRVKLNIMAVGLTRHHVIVITESFDVYEVARNQLKTSIDNLYLNAKPIPLKEKYPTLADYHRFRLIKFDIYNAFIVIDNDGSWLCLTTKPNSPYNGINFNMEKSTIIDGWSFTAQWKEVLISTTEPCHFYAIKRHNNQFQIGTYRCSSSTITKSQQIINENDYRSICYSMDSGDIKKIIIYPDGRDCPNPVDWPILKGFVAGKKFYLFGKDYIYSFDENAYHDPNHNSYPVRKQSYDSFFICPGKIPSPLIAISYLTLAMLTIIIFGFIILIILLAVKSLAIRQRKSSSLSAYNRTVRSMDTGKISLFQQITRIFTRSSDEIQRRSSSSSTTNNNNNNNNRHRSSNKRKSQKLSSKTKPQPPHSSTKRKQRSPIDISTSNKY